jgi:electron transport complex protein RnfB
LVREEAEHHKQLQAKAEHKLTDLAAYSKGTENAPEVDRKRAIIEAALAKAKARQTGA